MTGYNKVRYRGLAKNASRLHLLTAISNLLIGENICWRRGSSPEFRLNGGKEVKNEQMKMVITPESRLNVFFELKSDSAEN